MTKRRRERSSRGVEHDDGPLRDAVSHATGEETVWAPVAVPHPAVTPATITVGKPHSLA